jgi:hypothetical protein
MNLATAQEIAKRLQDVTAQLDDSIRIVQSSSTAEEFNKYRRIMGKLMGEIFLEVLQPLYNEYPSIVPPRLRPSKSD